MHPPRPFRIAVPDEALLDLRRRLLATRWPDASTESGWAQGVPLAVLQELCAYWASEYDWRSAEARLNRIPQFTVRADGLDVHLLHVRSPRADAIPLVLTHGWPGSFLEFEQTLLPLSEPESPAEPAFHVIVPSLPGYGFSAKPTEPGWGVHRIADAWTTITQALGYPAFVASGSDWGSSISTSLALRHPDSLLGLHVVPPLVPLRPDASGAPATPEEAAAFARLEERSRTGSGYSVVHATRPQTLGYGLTDSPAGLAAWILEKVWGWAEHDGNLWDVLSRDQVLDDVTLYWLTSSPASSARLYRESIGEVAGWFSGEVRDRVHVPTGCTVFPAEVPHPSRRQAERRFTRIVHWGEPARGGHFGAWEQPAAFVGELRQVARALGLGSGTDRRDGGRADGRQAGS